MPQVLCTIHFVSGAATAKPSSSSKIHFVPMGPEKSPEQLENQRESDSIDDDQVDYPYQNKLRIPTTIREIIKNDRLVGLMRYGSYEVGGLLVNYLPIMKNVSYLILFIYNEAGPERCPLKLRFHQGESFGESMEENLPNVPLGHSVVVVPFTDEMKKSNYLSLGINKDLEIHGLTRYNAHLFKRPSLSETNPAVLTRINFGNIGDGPTSWMEVENFKKIDHLHFPVPTGCDTFWFSHPIDDPDKLEVLYHLNEFMFLAGEIFDIRTRRWALGDNSKVYLTKQVSSLTLDSSGRAQTILNHFYNMLTN